MQDHVHYAALSDGEICSLWNFEDFDFAIMQVNTALQTVHTQVQAAVTKNHEQMLSSMQASTGAWHDDMRRLDAVLQRNHLE